MGVAPMRPVHFGANRGRGWLLDRSTGDDPPGGHARARKRSCSGSSRRIERRAEYAGGRSSCKTDQTAAGGRRSMSVRSGEWDWIRVGTLAIASALTALTFLRTGGGEERQASAPIA